MKNKLGFDVLENEPAESIACWIYFDASAYTDTGGWSVYYCEIEDHFGIEVTDELIKRIIEILERHPGVAEVSIEPGYISHGELEGDPCITVSLWDCYCGIVEEYEE